MDTKTQDPRHPFRGITIRGRSLQESVAAGWRVDPVIVADAFVVFAQGDVSRAAGLLVANVGASRAEAEQAVAAALAERA